jgi:hypothetical protein
MKLLCQIAGFIILVSCGVYQGYISWSQKEVIRELNARVWLLEHDVDGLFLKINPPVEVEYKIDHFNSLNNVM